MLLFFSHHLLHSWNISWRFLHIPETAKNWLAWIEYCEYILQGNGLHSCKPTHLVGFCTDLHRRNFNVDSSQFTLNGFWKRRQEMAKSIRRLQNQKLKSVSFSMYLCTIDVPINSTSFSNVFYNLQKAIFMDNPQTTLFAINCTLMNDGIYVRNVQGRDYLVYQLQLYKIVW